MPPTPGQLALLILAIASFGVGGVISLALRRASAASPATRWAKLCLYIGLALAIVVLVWHAARRGSWVPLEDNFDAFIWLAILLALFVAYVQRTRPLGGLDWFIMPIVLILLVAAGVFGKTRTRDYSAASQPWSVVHRLAAYSGAAAFFVAGAVGAMYLITNRRLRRKVAVTGPSFGSLERLEHVSMLAVTWGFGLLTIALVTGLVEALATDRAARLGHPWFASPKVLLTFVTWLVYAVVLHAPINPSFRGRKAAMLSIVGLFFMIVIVVAVQFMPRGGTR